MPRWLLPGACWSHWPSSGMPIARWPRITKGRHHVDMLGINWGFNIKSWGFMRIYSDLYAVEWCLMDVSWGCFSWFQQVYMGISWGYHGDIMGISWVTNDICRCYSLVISSGDSLKTSPWKFYSWGDHRSDEWSIKPCLMPHAIVGTWF